MGVPVTGGRRGRPTETTQRVGRSPTERRQRGSQPEERRIWQGVAQVAGEAVGHLALLIYPPAESVLRMVRFIRDTTMFSRPLSAARTHQGASPKQTRTPVF